MEKVKVIKISNKKKHNGVLKYYKYIEESPPPITHKLRIRYGPLFLSSSKEGGASPVCWPILQTFLFFLKNDEVLGVPDQPTRRKNIYFH